MRPMILLLFASGCGGSAFTSALPELGDAGPVSPVTVTDSGTLAAEDAPALVADARPRADRLGAVDDADVHVDAEPRPDAGLESEASLEAAPAPALCCLGKVEPFTQAQCPAAFAGPASAFTPSDAGLGTACALAACTGIVVVCP